MKKICFVIFISITLIGQTKDAYLLIQNVEKEFSKINDYQVDVEIFVDVKFIKVPQMKAKIYFKKPDKFRIKSDGFALLPKQGMNFSPSTIFNFDYSAIYVREENYDNKKVDVVKVIPTSDTAKVVLTTLWIDSQHKNIVKVESTTKDAGTFLILLNYENNQFALPSKAEFLFNTGDVRLPNFDPNKMSNENPKSNTEKMEGKVIIKYFNYKINKGISDSVFEEEKK
ncbi:MAG: hypothetical protein JXA68_07055 [Ignavibacteriales bacterium]|nr:hypothetical protein [Ignavibacteriales bacterium]